MVSVSLQKDYSSMECSIPQKHPGNSWAYKKWGLSASRNLFWVTSPPPFSHLKHYWGTLNSNSLDSHSVTQTMRQKDPMEIFSSRQFVSRPFFIKGTLISLKNEFLALKLLIFHSVPDSQPNSENCIWNLNFAALL